MRNGKVLQEKIQHEYYFYWVYIMIWMKSRKILNFYDSQNTSFKSTLKLTFFEIMSPEVRLRDKDDTDYKLD